MNEVGVDPGIDHMLAMQCFDEVKVHGGKVSSLLSINFLLCILSPCACFLFSTYVAVIGFIVARYTKTLTDGGFSNRVWF